MPQWTQDYTPIADSLWWSTLIAALPLVLLMASLALLRMRGHAAAVLSLSIALLVAILAYGMPPAMALSAAIYGFLYGLWPIAWIVVGAVFLYKIVVHSGQFEIIRASVLHITADRRLQMVLIGYAFGAFLEGAAGFGTPVAITAGLLVGLGFNPVYAAGLCLIANTAPVAFGALGLPVIVAGKVSSIDPFVIGQMAGRQLPLLSLLLPFWLVAVMDGWGGVRATWRATLVAGGSFSLTQFLTSNYLGPELPDIASAMVSLLATTLFLRYQSRRDGRTPAVAPYSGFEVLRAWGPFIGLTAIVTIWTLPPVKQYMQHYTLTVAVPALHHLVIKSAPIVPTPAPYEAVFRLDLLGATGTAILVTALLSAVMLRVPARACTGLFGATLRELSRPIVTIGSVLALAFVANYSGMSSTLGLAFAASGALFPLFSAFLGWLGVFLTGSDTASNALFGNLQRVTAEQIGVDPILTVAANTTGGVTGKMISPQSIAVACAAAKLPGREADLFRFTLRHSLVFALLIGVVTYLQSYFLTWMIPALPAQ
ncbi:MAG: Glycolate permease GlcA [Gammaproteobacteria bacterium]|nr:Glycolate permease GlcA [Gammaproteobacteria bacterium]